MVDLITFVNIFKNINLLGIDLVQLLTHIDNQKDNIYIKINSKGKTDSSYALLMFAIYLCFYKNSYNTAFIVDSIYVYKMVIIFVMDDIEKNTMLSKFVKHDKKNRCIKFVNNSQIKYYSKNELNKLVHIPKIDRLFIDNIDIKEIEKLENYAINTIIPRCLVINYKNK